MRTTIWQRMLSFTLALVMVLGMIPGGVITFPEAQAATISGDEIEGLTITTVRGTWDYTDGVITGESNNANASISLQNTRSDTIDLTFTVASLALYNDNAYAKLIIPEGATVTPALESDKLVAGTTYTVSGVPANDSCRIQFYSMGGASTLSLTQFVVSPMGSVDEGGAETEATETATNSDTVTTNDGVALAATPEVTGWNVEGLALSYTNANTYTSDNKGSLSKNDDGTLTISASGGWALSAYTTTTTLTFTNTLDRSAELYFTTTSNNVAAGTGATKLTTSSGYGFKLDAGGTVTVKVTSPDAYNQTNKATISDIAFVPSDITFTVSAQSENSSMGSASGGGAIVDGANATVTATANSGYVFGYWKDSAGNVVSAANPYTFACTADTTLTAVFYELGELFGVGTAAFDFWDTAIEYSNLTGNKTITLLKDHTMTESLTIPTGVTLLIPCKDGDTGLTGEGGGNPDGTGGGYVDTRETSAVPAYRTLTIPDGVTLTVYGDMIVNAVTGVKDSANAKHEITGGYAKVMIEEGGNIEVASGGEFRSYGITRGDGYVTAKDGGMVADVIMLPNWRGGTFMSNVYIKQMTVFPYFDYYMHHIEAPMTIEYGGVFKGMVKICAAVSLIDRTGFFHYSEFSYIGKDEGLFRMSPGSSMTRTYDADTDTETYTFTGGATVANVQLAAPNGSGGTINLNSNQYEAYPIVHGTQIVFENGDYFFNQGIKFMPGSGLTLRNHANLFVNASEMVNTKMDLALYSVDNYVDPGYIDYANNLSYPANLPAATMSLDATSALYNFGYFGGTIYTEADNIFNYQQGGSDNRKALATDPIWTVSPQEIKCTTNQYGDMSITTVGPFDLNIIRPLYNWSIDETDQHIVWDNILYVNLIAAIDEAEALDADCYTTDSWNALQTVIADARLLCNTEDTALIAEKEQAVENAITALVHKDLTITLVYDDGVTENGTINAKCGGTYADYYGGLPTPERTGYTFLGWYTGENGSGSKVENGTSLATKGNHTLTAQWTANTNTPYTVEHYWMGLDGNYPTSTTDATKGSGTTDTSTDYNDDAKPSEGFTVDTSRTSNVNIDGDGNAVLKIYYKRAQSTLTWNYNDDVTERKVEENIYFGAEIGKPADPTRRGYSFQHWFTGNDANNQAQFPLTMPAGDMTLTAYWGNPVEYTISYDVPVHDGAVRKYDVTSNVTLPIPERTGYTFAGWKITGNDAKEKIGDIIWEISAGDLIGNLTLTAQWTANTDTKYTVKHFQMNLDGETYTLADTEELSGTTDAQIAPAVKSYEGFTAPEKQTVTIKPDGSLVVEYHYARNQYKVTWDVDGSKTEVTYYYGAGIVLPEEPTKTGYTFAGWEGYTDDMTMPAEAVKFTATWTIKQYTITFANTGGTVIEPITQDYGSEVTAPEDPTRVGYTFAGWDKTIPATMGAENVTITAKWAPIKYTISYELDEGSVAGNPTSYTIESGDFTLPQPEREGYTFTGWTGTGLEQATKNVTVEQGSTGDRAYTATWTVNQYTITFDDTGDTVIEPITQNYGSEVTAPENPTKTGYNFAGWYIGDAKVEFPVTMPAGGTTITARWNAIRYSVAFDANGGTNTMTPQPFTYDGAQQLLKNQFNREGYAFAGWNTAADGSGTGYSDMQWVANLSAVNGTEVVLYAQWQANSINYTVEYYLQNVDGNGYTKDEDRKQTLFGDMDSQTAVDSAVAGEIEGFAFDKAENIKIAAGDGNVVKVYYTRNQYTVTWDVDGTQNTYTYYYGAAVTAPADPAKEGHTFAGWSPAVADTMPAEKVTYAATWTVNTYGLSWNLNGGTPSNEYTSGSVPYQADITAPVVSREGYAFAGWDKEVPGTMPAEALAFTAKWTAKEYTVTIYSNGGSECGDMKVTFDGTYGTLPVTTRNGYDFAGWYSDEALTELVTAETVYTTDGDTALYAKWAPIEYTISYELDGGSVEGNPTSYTIESGDFTLPQPEWEGYTFTGWTGTGLEQATKNVTVEQGSTGDRTYTAHWKANSYTVVFNANGGEGIMENQSLVWDDAEKPLTANSYIRKGYTFQGWARAENATEAEYKDGTKVSNLVSEGTVTLYAVWQIEAYEIAYVLNGGTVATANPASYTVQTDSFTLTNPTRDGYTFLGWTWEGQAEPMKTVTVAMGTAGNLKFTANWQINTYTITFHSNGGDAVEAVSRKYQETVQRTDVPEPGKEGHDFDGWYLDEALTKPVNYPFDMKEDLTFFAKWSINPYTITFANTGDTVIDPITQDYGTPVTKPADPTRTGYTFAGWEVEIPDTMPGSNVTISAKWTINQYTITFDTAGGSDVEAITQDYGTDVTAPANPTKKGYSFAGWDVALPGTMPAGDMTITAKWTINQYSVTFDPNGGDSIEPIRQNYLTQVTALPDAVRAGYRFDGWFYADGTPVSLPITLEEDVEIEARWTSYLELLMSIAPADFEKAESDESHREVLEQAREYFNLMKLDGEQLAKYQGTEEYASHWTALETEIREVTLLELEHSIESKETLDKVNDLLTDNGKAAATLDVNAGENHVDIWLEEPDRKAADFLTIQFLTTLLSNKNIWSIHFPDMEYEAENGVLLTPYGNGVESLQQLDLMVRVAHVTINTPEITQSENKLTYGEFYTWLSAGKIVEDGEEKLVRDVLTIGTLDGKSLTIVVNAKTPEGVEFSTPYVLAFYNRAHDVTWDVDGVTTTKTYNYKDPITKPDVPTKEGYTFAGWEGYTDGMTMGKENVTFKAKWTANQYTVTLDASGGTVGKATVTVTYGLPYDLPIPSREGYTFEGWFYADGKQVPANVDITADATFVAQWTVGKSYKVSYDLAGGQWAKDASYRKEYNVETDSFTLPQPVREGYTFAGWIGTGLTEATKDVTVEKGSTGDRSYTATWTAIQYTITFVPGNGEENIVVKRDYGTTVDVPADPTREGYTFDGWDVEIPTTMPAGDMTITAKWKVNTYTLTYWVDGEVYKTLKLYYGDMVVLEQEPTKTGYTFSGWNQTAMPMPAHDVQISGTFTANTYTVHFDANYPAAPAVQDGSVDFDSAYGTLPVVTRTGYTFAGWRVSGTTVTADTLVKTAGEHTLVAQWNPNTYKVTLVLDGGKCAVTEVAVTYDGTYAALPTPTREGYDFIGWFDGETQILNGTKVSITGDQTLTARWKASGNTPYTVEHYQQALDGTYVLARTERLTGAADTLTQAQQQSFAGFLVNASLGVTSGMIAPDGSLVLKLYYDRNSYDVVWNVAGKQIRETYLFGQTLNVPDTAWAESVHSRYDFVKWDQELPETVTGSVTYTAEYSVYYEATIGNQTYRTLALALANAKSGQTVRLARDVTVNEDLTVPKNVLLLIPCKDGDNGYDMKYEGKLKFNYDAPDSNGVASLYRTLTVSEGVTLTIEGTVLLNSVSGRTGSGEQDITGGYGRMALNGEAVVADGGLLDCFGFITGTGKVTVENGGTASDMYIVRHWRGGTQAYNMYVEDIYPMNEYDCRNIEVDVVIHYGGSYEGLVKMYAGNEYNYTRYPQVHVSNGLIRLSSGDGYVVRSYADGVETYKIYGGAEIASSALTILGVDLTTADFIYPVDGDIRYELYGGRYDIVNDYKFLPGSAVLVGSDASLHVAEGVTVVFYQEFNDVDNTGNTEYPAGRAPAVLTIQEGASFTNAGTFAGHIYTESPDIWIGVNPVWDAVTKEANGLAASLPEDVETYVELQHTLSIERPGHTWKYGSDRSIVWDGYADYSAVQQAIASIPKDLEYYTPESVAAIQPAVDAVIYNLPVERQAEVDAMAVPIQAAVAGLVPRTITVTLDANGGTVGYTSFEATCTMAIGTLPTPTREYYTFQGWYDADGNRVTAKTVVLTKTDMTITAKWKIKNADYTAVVRARRQIPSDMSMYSDASAAAVNAANNAVVTGLTADRQAEVNAMAQAILDAIDNLAYTVTLDANGGNVAPATLEKIRKEVDYTGLPTPVRPGYRFDGWFLADGTRVTAGSTPIQGPHTLKAQWTAVPADYTGVDAALTRIPADLSCYTGETAAAVQAAADAVVRGLLQDRQDEVDAMAQAILDAIAALKLYPVQVTFEPNGGTVDVTAMTVEYTQAYGVLPVPARPGYRFDGWFNAAGEQVTAQTIVNSKEAVTLKARWTAIPADYTGVDAALAKIPADLSCYTGDTAAAVQEAADAVVRGLLQDRQDEVDAMAQAILDAIAALKKKAVTVTTDDGNGNIERMEVIFGEAIGELPEPEDTCKVFLGWYNGEGKRVTWDTVIDSLEDLNLTAKWQAVCLEETGDDYAVTVHYHGEEDEISYVDVIVDPSVTGDAMTLRIPVALPTTKDSAQAPLIHVEVPDGVKLRLEIPMDTLHYGNVAMIDPGTAEMTIINETIVTENGIALAVTSSVDFRVVENSISFPDVPEGNWAKDTVDYLSARRYILGKYDGTYAPTETIMRKTVIMMLWRFAGSPDPESMVSPFPDVQNPNDIYYKAILWAYETGVTRGYTDGTFGGDNVILRQHFAAMIHRYAQLFNYELPAADNGRIEDFVDYDQIGASFYENVQWALDCGLMLGHRDGQYKPVGETPRDQMSVVFFRFLQAYNLAVYEADPE